MARTVLTRALQVAVIIAIVAFFLYATDGRATLP